MAHAPRNLRTKNPRSLPKPTRGSDPGRPPLSRRVYRGTPTPPPVVVAAKPPVAPKSGPGRAPEVEPADDPPPEAPSRTSLSGWALMALLSLVCLASAIALRTLRQHEDWFANIDIGLPEVAAAAKAPPPPAAPEPVASAKKPDKATGWTVKHDGYAPVTGGVLHFPKHFTAKPDGSYDLVVFFHGNPAIVLQSIEHLRMDVALCIINLGLRSQPYRQAYSAPGSFERLMVEVEQGLRSRGIQQPKLRRLALTSWSAGYGAIESILETRNSPSADRDPLDAIISLDGVHAGYRGEGRDLNPRSVRAYMRAVKAAADGHLWMRLTHSEIPTGTYASARETQHYLLSELGKKVSEPPVLEMPPALRLPAAHHAVKKHHRMVPISDTRVGLLRVRGFEGTTEDHHSAHLTQMAPIAFTDLARRWREPPPDRDAD